MGEVLPPLPAVPPLAVPGTPSGSRRGGGGGGLPSSRAVQLQRALSGDIDPTDASQQPPQSPQPPPPLPRTLDFGPDPVSEFDMLEKIGEGSFGAVWKVLHKRSSTVLAVKIITIDDNLDELYREVRTMSALDHPNIVRFFTSYKRDAELWLVMEFCSARSLRNVIKSLKRGLSEPEIAAVMRQMLDALFYLHGKNRIHRDLKAGNILLQSDGTAKLGDFGVAGQITDTQKRRHTMIGSPYWMSPEVIQDLGHDQKADLWSLGITAIELAELDPPYFDSNPMKVIFMIPHNDPPTVKDAKWSSAFREFLAKCLVKNPDERWSAAELQRLPFITTAGASEALKSLATEHETLLTAQAKARSPLSSEAHLQSPDTSTDMGASMSLSPSFGAVERRDLPSISGSMALRALNDLDRDMRPQACPTCEQLQHRVQELERQVDELRQKLMATTAEANLYKGQVLVFERLMSGSVKRP